MASADEHAQADAALSPGGLPPGEPLSAQQSALNAATSLLQGFKPLHKLCQHVCAFHCYAHDTTRQVHAHHVCSHLNEEVRQCLIYESDAANARLIGVEFIISRRLFEDLPQDEKRFWHSHVHEVASGQLAALGVPLAAANIDAAKLIDSYGKTWHFWQVDRGDPLPYGPPQLMMSFTRDGQLDPVLLAARDAGHGIDTAQIRASRAHLAQSAPSPHPEADHPWRSGRAWTTVMQERPAKLAGPGAGAPAGADEAEAAAGSAPEAGLAAEQLQRVQLRTQ